MISLSHWGMFPRPRLVLVLPALSSGDMARLEEEMKQPGNIVEIKHDVTPQWISPALDQAIQDEFDHPPADIAKEE